LNATASGSLFMEPIFCTALKDINPAAHSDISASDHIDTHVIIVSCSVTCVAQGDEKNFFGKMRRKSTFGAISVADSTVWVSHTGSETRPRRR